MQPKDSLHPAFRMVRHTVGEASPEYASQGKFGKLLDVSGPTVQAIELGKLTLSDQLALRTTLRTGVHFFDLRRKSANPRDIWGDPYSTDSFLKVRGYLTNTAYKKRPASQRIQASTKLISTLLQAVEQNDQLDLALVLLNTHIIKLVERFRVAGTLSKIDPRVNYEDIVVDSLADLIASRDDI